MGCLLLLAVKLENGGFLLLFLPLLLGPNFGPGFWLGNTIFSGTIRHCLVPFSFHGHLATTPHALCGKCGTPLADRRSSLAVGHRQKRCVFC